MVKDNPTCNPTFSVYCVLFYFILFFPHFLPTFTRDDFIYSQRWVGNFGCYHIFWYIEATDSGEIPASS